VFNVALLSKKSDEDKKVANNVHVRDKKKIHIFDQVKSFNMGTIDYFEDQEKEFKEKRYVPIFPQLYTY